MPCHCSTSLLTYSSVCFQWLQCVRLPVSVILKDFWCGTSQNSIFQVNNAFVTEAHLSMGTVIDNFSSDRNPATPLTIAPSIARSLSLWSSVSPIPSESSKCIINMLSIGCYKYRKRNRLTSYQSGCCCWYGDTDKGRWEGPHRERRREEAPSLAQQLDTNSNWEKSSSAVHPVSTEHTNKGEVLA